MLTTIPPGAYPPVTGHEYGGTARPSDDLNYLPVRCHQWWKDGLHPASSRYALWNRLHCKGGRRAHEGAGSECVDAGADHGELPMSASDDCRTEPRGIWLVAWLAASAACT